VIVSVKEARDILGEDAVTMSDAEIEEVVGTLDLLAKESFRKAQVKLQMKKDAKALAEFFYILHEIDVSNKKHPKDKS
jgi:hypothetical protein